MSCGLIVVVTNKGIDLYSTRSNTPLRYIGCSIIRYFKHIQYYNIGWTRSAFVYKFIQEWNIVSPLDVKYTTNEDDCKTVDDVIKTYQQESYDYDYIYVLENIEEGEFKVTFSNAHIKCLSEYTQDYVILTQNAFERLMEHWSHLSHKWSDASVGKKRWLVAMLDSTSKKVRQVCARNIQTIWRGHNVRWKIPCFSFNDNDGTVPLRPRKKPRSKGPSDVT